MPDDLAKLSNVVKNEVVKKTNFSADDYVKKTKFSGDINSLDDKIDKVEKKIPDVSSLETKRNVTTLVKNLDNRIDGLKKKEYAKKTILSNYMLNSDFNTKSMGKDLIQGINDTTIYAEKLFHNNFTEFGVKFVLHLHYNGDNSYLFANGREELKFKAQDDQLINEKLCLGNLSSE